MKARIPAPLVLSLVVAVCGSLIVVAALLRSRGRSLADWLARIPPEEGVVVYADLEALRRAGVLEWFALSRLSEEPEYQAFVNNTGFDVRQDLRAALIAFQPAGNFFLLRGRFDWASLNRFVESQGGNCHNTFCRVTGSRPERRISYFPLRPDVMAMAVSTDSWAAARLHNRWRRVQSSDIPPAPLWAMVSVRTLASAKTLPTGTHLFARALAGAERLVFYATPAADHLELHLEVTCGSTQQAASLLTQLRGLTEALKAMLAREGQKPNPRDLSGVLVAGVFEQNDRRVHGRWPLGRPFLEALTAP